MGEFETRGLNLKHWEPDQSKLFIKPAGSSQLVDDIDELAGFVDLVEETGETLVVDSWSFKIVKI